MVSHLWAGARMGRRAVLMHLDGGRNPAVRIVPPPLNVVAAWSWGDDSPAAHALALYLLKEAVGPEAATDDLADDYVDHVLSELGDAWHLTEADVRNWVETALLWDSVELLKAYREDA